MFICISPTLISSLHPEPSHPYPYIFPNAVPLLRFYSILVLSLWANPPGKNAVPAAGACLEEQPVPVSQVGGSLPRPSPVPYSYSVAAQPLWSWGR